MLISAGAWGAGSHMAQTARLVAAAGYRPVVLCGKNARLRREVSGTGHVLAAGWVQDMAGLMAASSALIDNAAGQTALEALAVGVPVVGYRPIPGHGRTASAGWRSEASLTTRETPGRWSSHWMP
ncbi:hypothetical protein NKH18_03740 [Streptomyces sp. M10(2022)]